MHNVNCCAISTPKGCFAIDAISYADCKEADSINCKNKEISYGSTYILCTAFCPFAFTEFNCAPPHATLWVAISTADCYPDTVQDLTDLLARAVTNKFRISPPGYHMWNSVLRLRLAVLRRVTVGCSLLQS